MLGGRAGGEQRLVGFAPDEPKGDVGLCLARDEEAVDTETFTGLSTVVVDRIDLEARHRRHGAGTGAAPHLGVFDDAGSHDDVDETRIGRVGPVGDDDRVHEAPGELGHALVPDRDFQSAQRPRCFVGPGDHVVPGPLGLAPPYRQHLTRWRHRIDEQALDVRAPSPVFDLEFRVQPTQQVLDREAMSPRGVILALHTASGQSNDLDAPV
ncbi:hypothetical protein ADK60_19320, partial [Streptomyces sp. XY431]|uniref:hypothetical protein n=1 Tax=Streptomyces sp. XY431 TaxID=1415562 RepID=UPI0006C62906